MEIEVLYRNFLKNDPKQLMDYIQRVASGEAPFFPTTLSLVFEKLIGTKFPKPDSEQPPEGQNVTTSNPVQASSSTVVAPASISTSNGGSSTTPTVTPPPTISPLAYPPPNAGKMWLRCVRCRECTRVANLTGGLRCPWCLPLVMQMKEASMACTGCGRKRTGRVDTCTAADCRAIFM